MPTRGSQALLEGYARTVARGGAGRTMAANIAAMDALVTAGLAPDGNTVNGSTRTGGLAYDHVVAQFPREELSQWEIPSPLLNVTGAGGGLYLDLREFGVKADGVTDDGPGFNAAIAYAKANLASSGAVTALLWWPSGTSYIATTLDMTGFQGVAIVNVQAPATVFMCHTTGMPTVDMTGSTNMHWYGGRFLGDAVYTPVCAFRLGRAAVPPNSGARCVIQDVIIHGSFQKTCLYLNQAENFIGRNILASNQFPTATDLAGNPSAGDAHAVTLDGISNYWSAVPTVCAGAVSPGLGSFIGPTFNACAFSASGGNISSPPTAIWLGHTQGATFNGSCYAVTTGTVGGPVITAWSVAGSSLHNLNLENMHKECQIANGWPVVLFAGPLVGQSGLESWRFSDGSTAGQATHLFASAPGVTHVILEALELRVSNPNTMAFIFDGNYYTVSGDIYLGNATPIWDTTIGGFHSTFTGTLNQNGIIQTYTGGGDTLTGGLVLTDVQASAPNDLSQHIQVHSAGYGISFTAGRLNFVSAVQTFFVTSAGVDIGYIAPSGLNAMPVGAAVPSTGLFTTLTAQGAISAQTNVSIGGNAAALNVGAILNGAATSSRQLRWNTAGQARWGQGVNAIAEGGSDAGGDFIISRYHDAGTAIDNPVTITRSTGSVTLHAGLGVWNATPPAAKPAVSGSRGGNAALASLLTALASYGIITDSSTA